MSRHSDSGLVQFEFETCALVSNYGQVRALCIAPVHLAELINLELVINNDRYLWTNSLRAFIVAWLGPSLGSRESDKLNRSVRE